MADEAYEITSTENNDDFTINGDDTSFSQPPEETEEYEQSHCSEMIAPGTEDDMNGTSEYQYHQHQELEEQEHEHLLQHGGEEQSEEKEESKEATSALSNDEENENIQNDDGAENENQEQTSENHQDGPRPPRSEDGDKKLFVGGLTWDTTPAQVREHFEQYGEIENVDLKLDYEGHSRGFAFVQFYDPSIIDKVIKIGEHKINGKFVDPKPANPRGGGGPRGPGRGPPREEEPMKKVFVGGVTPELDDETIRTHFMQYGEVDAVERPRSLGPQRKKYCFVTFFDEEAAKRSIVSNKQDIGGTICDVNKATPKQDFPRGPYEGGGRGGWGGDRGFGGPPRGRGRGRGYGPGGYGAPGYGGGYDQGYGGGYDQGYGGYDYSGYPGYDYSGYGGGYDPNAYYGGYDPNYYQNYGGYDWSGYYNQQSGYDYSGYYGQGTTETAAATPAPATYEGGKAKRGSPAASTAGYHPYRKQ